LRRKNANQHKPTGEIRQKTTHFGQNHEKYAAIFLVYLDATHKILPPYQ
jgi:hypothetical protein